MMRYHFAAGDEPLLKRCRDALPKHTSHAQSDNVVVRAENLEKNFGTQAVLRGVSLAAKKGEVVAILGGSGSGKSTFLRCLNLLEVPDRGRVWVGQTQLFPPAEIIEPGSYRRALFGARAAIGMVFQSFHLWPHRTIIENVAEGPLHVLRLPPHAATERAEYYLRKVGLIDKRGDYPRHLSGGQQQRAAIARALSMEPELLLFDEPTSALDPELVAEVLKVMTGLAEDGRTMVIVTHELAFAREVSTHTAFMYGGKILEEGRSTSVFARPQSEELRRFLKRHY